MKNTILAALMMTVLTACGGGLTQNNGVDPRPQPTSTPPRPAPSSAKYVYVMSAGDDLINQYSLENGIISPLSQPSIATGMTPMSITTDSARRFVYVFNNSDGTLSQYVVGTNGALTEIASPIPVSGYPYAIVASPDAKSVYGMEWDSISRYSIGTDGSLTYVENLSNPEGPVGMTFSPDGKYAYSANMMSETLSQYSVGSDGSLTPLTPATVPTTGCSSGPIQSIQLSDGGSYVYALSCMAQAIDAFQIGNDGTLVHLQTIPTGPIPEGMFVTSTNIYVTNLGDGTISMYGIASDGSLSTLSTITVSDMPEAIAVDAVAKMAYLIDSNSGVITPYAVSDTGELIPHSSGAVSTGSSPRQILLK